MVQRYPQENRRSSSGCFARQHHSGTSLCGEQRYGENLSSRIADSHLGGTSHEQWYAYLSEESKPSGTCPYDREVGGSMLSVTGLNHFYYLCNFTDMRCKHSRILSVIREQLRREPNPGDVYIVMSKNCRIVRMFAYDYRSYSLFEKKFVAGYQFMKVEINGYV